MHWITRIPWLQACVCMAVAAGAEVGALAAEPSDATNAPPFGREDVARAGKLIGLEFTDREIDLAQPGLIQQLETFRKVRAFPLSNTVPPAIQFNPIPIGFKWPTGKDRFRPAKPPRAKRPADLQALAFYPVTQLSELVRTRQVSSEELTRLYLDRLKRYGPKLECVITLTEERALEQARRADAELARGHYRGPLHGIPYGAKDLLDTRGIRTTWGSPPYTNRVPAADATVVRRLEEAGAVLVAKTTLGELAWGDVWFGGMTRNPWNVKQGSSGSSAGSASGVAGGLFAFAIGSETYGSIVSPSDRCGVTGLRPSYGRVSRTGAMSLSWTMDKLGPMARSVEDCALVFNIIHGPDGVDGTVYDVPFVYEAKVDLTKLRIGYLQEDFAKQKGERKEHDDRALAKLRELGANLVPVRIPEFPLDDISFVLSTEGAAGFEDLTRENRDDGMNRQERMAWPNVFREARYVPAVEYLQAQRIRHLFLQEMARIFDGVEIIVAPSLSGGSLLAGNLSGHPCVVLPNGFTRAGTPASLCFLGRLFDEGKLLAVAKRYQDATDYHLKHPDLEKLP